MSEERRPTLVLRLRALPGVDAIRELRMLLKRLVHQNGFRAVYRLKRRMHPLKLAPKGNIIRRTCPKRNESITFSKRRSNHG